MNKKKSALSMLHDPRLIPEPCCVARTLTACSSGIQSIRLPQMVKRSISSKSFFGVLCLSPSPSSPVSALMILSSSSSSSGVVRKVSESLLGSVGVELSAMFAGWGLTDARDIPPLSAVGSA